MGWDYNSHIVCMCIIMRWSRNRSASWQRDFGPPHYYAHTNYVTIILPSQSCLLSFLHHPYMWPFSICKIFHLLVYIVSNPFIDLLKPTFPASTGALSGPGEEAVPTIDMVYVSQFTRPVRVCVSVEPSLTVSLPLSLSLV